MTYAETVETLPIVTSDYDSFTKALAHNGARCMWQITEKELKKIGVNNMNAIECWHLPNGKQVITQAWGKNNGWNYFIQTEKHKIHDCITELGLEARAA